jgi:stage II sporulation protein AA (anti-sigma F factor antagonist)
MLTAPEAFTIGSEVRGGTQRIVVAGEIDVCAAMRLRGHFDRLLADSGRPIELDLRDVTFMDSAGVHLLGYMRRRAGAPLRVIPSVAVRHVVHVAAEAVVHDRDASGLGGASASWPRAKAASANPGANPSDCALAIRSRTTPARRVRPTDRTNRKTR